MSSWQQQHRLPRIVSDSSTNAVRKSEGGKGTQTSTSSLSSSRQMGPPSQSLPSLNFRQLAPLRSPNLASSTRSNYFHQQRNRSTSESIGNDALRSLRLGLPPPPDLPGHTFKMISSTFRGETLPPLAACGSSPSAGSLLGEQIPRPIKQSPSQQHVFHYHPYQSRPNMLYRSPPCHHTPSSPPQLGSTAIGAAPPYYTGIPSRASHDSSRYFSPSSPSNTFDHNMDRSRESSSTMDRDDSSPRKLAKSHVPSACLNCKRAHLACDVSRPCRRCMNLGKTDSCIDVQHKKRGRPRLRDREAAAAASITGGTNSTVSGRPEMDQRMSSSGLPSQRMRGSMSSISSSNSTMRQSPRSEPTTFFSPSAESGISKASSSMSSLNQRSRSISSNASLWSQNTHPPPPPGVCASGDYSIDTAPPTVSLILSTGLQCARCSVESHALLGYSPSDLMETSLFELVHPSETQRLEHLWLSLIEPIGIKPQVVPANAETVMNLSPAILMAPAPGTVYIQETMRLRRRSGIYDFCSIRLHLGGGFGADLYQSSTLDRAYIVASLLKLGNDATHSDPNILREARWHHGKDPLHFTTPPSKGPSGDGNNSSGGGGTVTEYSSMQSNSGRQHYQHHYKSDPSAPNRYDWQRMDEKTNRRTIAAPRSSRSSPSPPPYSRNAFQSDFHHQCDSKSNGRKRGRSPSSSSSFLTKREDHHHRNGPNSSVKKSSSSIHFSYSSRAESGGILC